MGNKGEVNRARDEIDYDGGGLERLVEPAGYNSAQKSRKGSSSLLARPKTAR